ncbi:uncharacterized protein EDB91DRAFT_809636 [Suillus paluster]|uniref:uncharacterized protein n=1 Tax=Suillus paluster TaxID=48578 RepID=UPI001B85B469|nr:uncharacterized protein EDB91DRAFT_809636 [Suillus paluster]KAG1729480.1 hypothetical protein EDB91DRAFT_809636 [Suillus paluster]
MPFPWLKDLGNVISVRRSRRPTKNRRTQCSSTATDYEGDDSVLLDSPLHLDCASREPGFQVSTNVSSTRYSQGVSLTREASDMAQLALPLVQAVAGAIPLVGAPMQAAIGGLLTSLQAIDRHGQNNADINSLTLRLHRLSCHLCNAPPTRDPLEQSRRDSLIRVLEAASAQLTKLHKRRRLAYASVTQTITGCSGEIDRYLVECLWSFQMQSQNDIHEMRDLIIRGQSAVGPTAMKLSGTIVLGCVTLVDATGHEHAISVNFCTSFQQLNKVLEALFERDSIEAQIQKQYMKEGQYDLCIDKGTQIVMRVIIEQRVGSSRVSYRCHFCGAWNRLPTGSISHSLRRQPGCSINCRECKRRFQISRVLRSAKQSTRTSSIGSNRTTDAEMHLIRNFHVQQTVGNWLCDTCMLSNPDTAELKCAICDSARPGTASAPAPTGFDWSAAGMKAPCSSTDMQTCSVCMLQSSTAATKCTICDSAWDTLH